MNERNETNERKENAPSFIRFDEKIEQNMQKYELKQINVI